MKPGSAKQKGTKFEKLAAGLLDGIEGVSCRRQPGSGIYSDFPHDLRLRVGELDFICECKAWKEGWRTGDKAMGQAEILLIKRNYAEPRVYMTLGAFKALLEAINGPQDS